MRHTRQLRHTCIRRTVCNGSLACIGHCEPPAHQARAYALLPPRAGTPCLQARSPGATNVMVQEVIGRTPVCPHRQGMQSQAGGQGWGAIAHVQPVQGEAEMETMWMSGESSRTGSTI